MSAPLHFKRFDVRKLIAAGIEPVPHIRKRIDALKSHEGLELVAPFLPSPLIVPPDQFITLAIVTVPVPPSVPPTKSRFETSKLALAGRTTSVYRCDVVPPAERGGDVRCFSDTSPVTALA